MGTRAQTAAVGLVAFVIVVARVAVAGALDLLWAEDGAVFIEQAAHNGPAVIADPYMGYLHLAPRLIAEAVTLLPASWFGVATVLAAAATIGALAAVVYRTALEIIVPAAAAAAALVLAVAPAAGHEAVGSIAHLHWFLAYAAVWLVVAKSDRGGPVILLALASSPLALLLVPFARRWWPWVATGAGAQAVAMLTASAGRAGPASAGYPPVERFVSAALTSPVDSMSVGAVALVVVILLVGRSGRWEAWALAAGAVVVYAAAVAANGRVEVRYEVLPQMLLWASVVVAAAGQVRWRMVAACGAVAVVLVGFAASPYRSSGHVSDGCPVPSAPDGWDVDCM